MCYNRIAMKDGPFERAGFSFYKLPPYFVFLFTMKDISGCYKYNLLILFYQPTIWTNDPFDKTFIILPYYNPFCIAEYALLFSFVHNLIIIKKAHI